MSDPSDKAVEHATDGQAQPHHRREAVFMAHDPALGLDRSVCAREFLAEIVEALNERAEQQYIATFQAAADFIECEFGGES